MNIDQLKKTMISKIQHDTPKNIKKSSSVLIIINSHLPKIIMIKRGYHLSLHKGEMAFPGGKYDYSDNNILDTAMLSGAIFITFSNSFFALSIIQRSK